MDKDVLFSVSDSSPPPPISERDESTQQEGAAAAKPCSGIRGQLWQLTQFAFKAKASEFLHADIALPEAAPHGSL